jgi:hypothetical protein
VDDDPPPTLSIGNATVNEGNGGASNATSPSPCRGEWPTSDRRLATADGTATAGLDYGDERHATFPPEPPRRRSRCRSRETLDGTTETFTAVLSNAITRSWYDRPGTICVNDNDDGIDAQRNGDGG